MSTVTANLASDNSTDAVFRLWCQFIHDAFVTTAGWVDTAATGSIDFTTVLKPTGTGVYMGFKVYRMADALQATYPCFVKVEFGSEGAQTQPSVRLSIGTVHNGSGTLTGAQLHTLKRCGNNTSSATLYPCFAGGSTSRIAFAMFADDSGATGRPFYWGIERTKDAAGADNGDAVVLITSGYIAGTATTCMAVVPPSGGVPPAAIAIPTVIDRSGVASVYNSNTAVGLPVPIAGAALRPLTMFAFTSSFDAVTPLTTISATVYGAAHTFLSLASSTAPNAAYIGGGSATVPIRWLLRYE